MTAIVSWNVQYGVGCDGVLDLARTAAVLRALGPADVLCLQEVARGEPTIADGADQVAALAALLPGHAAVFGAAYDRLRPDGGRAEFGNLVLSRLPVLQAFRHPLPQPADPAALKSMPRLALEVVVAAEEGPLRVVTTHLEFHSAAQRLAQVERLRELHREAGLCERAPGPPIADGTYATLPRPSALVLCGDFNFEPESEEYRRITAPFADGIAALGDAWSALHAGCPHEPTCGIHDRDQWQNGPNARDFFFVGAPLACRLQAVSVDLDTAASDHQPVKLLLG